MGYCRTSAQRYGTNKSLRCVDKPELQRYQFGAVKVLN